MNKYLTEFIGTYFLVLTIGLTGIPSAPGVIPPLAIGGVLVVLVYAGGHISGAHYNPAVTVAIWLRGRCETKEIAPYFIAQVLASVGAAATAGFLVGPGTPMAMNGTAAPLVAEFLFTFALVYVILNVATARGTEGNPYYGLAIGFTVMAAAFAVGDISGAVLNPAVAAGVVIMRLVDAGDVWIHLVAEFAGACAAAAAFRIINPDDK